MSVIDRERLENEYGGDEEILVEAAEVFLETLPGVVERLEKSVQNGVAKEIAETAHELKGMVGVFTLQKLYEACKALEHMGRDGNLDKKDEQIGVVRTNLVSFESSLKEYIEELKAKL